MGFFQKAYLAVKIKIFLMLENLKEMGYKESHFMGWGVNIHWERCY
jgi:hypothetical protein